MVPPSLQTGGSGGGVAAQAGTPVAVPDALVSPDVKFATTTEILVATPEMGSGGGFNGDGSEGLGAVEINKPVEVSKPDEIPDPEEFISVEKEPDFDLADLNKRVKFPGDRQA